MASPASKTSPDEKISALAAKMRGIGASVRRDADGTPVITMPVGGGRGSRAGERGIGSNSAGQLKAFIERIERLEEEKATIASDIKDVYGEAKGTGFDAKIIRKIIRMRREDPDVRRAAEEILGTYLHALGME